MVNHTKKKKPVKKQTKRAVQVKRRKMLLILAILALVIVLFLSCGSHRGRQENGSEEQAGEGLLEGRIDVQLLTPNPYSRPQIAVPKVNNIVVHYLANPGSTAQANHDWFESLATTGEDYISSNFLIGLDGEIIQCVPTNEMAYASNDRNGDTVSIECCHPDESGVLNDETYDSLVWLTAYLCRKFDLGAQDVIRHYDVTGKICPKWAVDDPQAWETFKDRVADEIKRQKKAKKAEE